MSAENTVPTEKNNSNASLPQKRDWRKRLADVLVIIFCVSGAAFSLNLFRLDLFQSIASQNKKPIGAVTVKYNNVQRRLSERVLWGRLTVESPVYPDDLIRVAEYSAATININDNIIEINENSLIRIRVSQDGKNRFIIDMSSGSLSITGSGDADNGIALNVMGRIIAPAAGATLSASVEKNGMTLQVNGGKAVVTGGDGQSRSISSGDVFILDANGVEQAMPSAVVTLPLPNARFIKNNDEPVNIRFEWNVLNIDQKSPLRLEVTAEPDFTSIVRTADGVGFSNVTLGGGNWYWRLSYHGIALSSGQFAIVDAAITLLSPIKNSLFRYREKPPSVRFEWKPVEGASNYILEAGLTPDMAHSSITRQTAVASFVEHGMMAGTWYWRVKPVFSSLYEGSAIFSQISSFRIVKIEDAAGLPEQEPSPDNSLSGPDIFITSSAGWKSLTDISSKSDISIARETIDGVERNVLTINADLNWEPYGRWAGVTLTEENYLNKNLAPKTKAKLKGTTMTDIKLIQKLINANGIRFKVLGDGKKWKVYFATTDVTDTAFFGLTITTQNNKVTSIDIPYNRLNQPVWGIRSKFNKNNLKGITIEKNSDTGSFGASVIKVFDFETY